MARCGTILRQITSRIEPLYGEREAASIARIVVSERTNLTISQLLAGPEREVQISDLDNLIEQLACGRPLQYVLGWEEFSALRFEVGEGVLIPRPETEELVLRVVSSLKELSKSNPKVLDVGCGSGCIAISTKNLYPEAEVTALDISTEALDIAHRNAQRLAPEVRVIRGDALNLRESLAGEKFDIIVSNPPYIPQSEEQSMRINVTGYEPHLALFVPDDDPLKFYRAIAHSALEMLNEGGMLWFEAHEEYAQKTLDMILCEGFKQGGVVKDIFDKERMVWASK